MKKIKKLLMDDIYLKDKYDILNEKNEMKTFVSDLQMEKLLKLAEKESKFNVVRKEFQNKVRLELIDIIYAFSFMVFFPSIISYLIYDHLFINNGVDGIFAYAGTFGAFIISGVLLVGMTSKMYENLSGGVSFHEIKKVRGNKAFYSSLRENEKISNVFNIILNQRKEMKKSYIEKTLDKNTIKKYYDEVNIDEFSYKEEKLVKSIIKEVENFL